MRARKAVNEFRHGAIDEKSGLSYNKRMKKTVFLLLLIAICLAAALCLASCGGSAPVKLTIVSLPDKQTVTQGYAPDLTGGIVLVEYENGEEEEIAMSDLEVRGFDSSVLGKQSAVLVYTVKGKSASVVVDLTVVYPKVTRLEVSDSDPRDHYFVGEKFDKSNLVVTAYYATGTSETVELYTISPSKLTLSTTEVTISYREGKATIPVTVLAKAPVSLKVEGKDQAKTTYFVGEEFSSEGLFATVTYNDGTTERFGQEELAFLRPVTREEYTEPLYDSDDRVLVTAYTAYGEVSSELVLTVTEVLPVQMTATGNLTFFEGESFSFESGEITVTVLYNNEQEEVLTANGNRFSYEDEPLVFGQTGVEIWMGSYDAVKATVSVTVKRPAVESFRIVRLPTKWLYNAGESVELDGMILLVTLEANRTMVVEYDETPEGIEASIDCVAADTESITVRYQGCEESYTIRVNS